MVVEAISNLALFVIFLWRVPSHHVISAKFGVKYIDIMGLEFTVLILVSTIELLSLAYEGLYFCAHFRDIPISTLSD